MLLKSKYGNVFKTVNSPAKIERLKEQGYSEVKVNKPAPRKAKAPKDK